MKRSLLSLVTILLATGFVSARTKQDFDKFLKQTASQVENYPNEKYYESLEFTNPKTNEKKKFSDFPKVDRFIFMLIKCDTLSREMEDLYNKWDEELKKAEDTPDDASEASKKDVTNYMNKLMTLRKQNAEKVESMVGELFKQYPDKFTKEEQDYIIKSVRG